MSTIKEALQLASYGLRIFPLIPNSKKPAIKDFPNLATNDPETLKKMWTNPNYNIGISTSGYNCTQALLAVDVDNKGKKKGSEEILKLELEGKEFPQTFTQITPTGGEHLIYCVDEPVKQGVNVLGEGLDIRSKGGYLVGAGSVIDGKKYLIKAKSGTKIVPAQAWLKETCGKAPEKSNVEVDTSRINQEQATLRAIDYLKRSAPLSIKGQGGDATAYQVAARMKDFGLDPQTILDLMMDHWNDRCPPGWHPDKLMAKIQHAFRYGTEKPGTDAPETKFDKVESEESFYLKEMNNKYAILYESGGHVILEETEDMYGEYTARFLPEATFKRMYSPYTVQQGKGKALSYAEIWLDWKDRREFKKGICFSPGKDPGPEFYNTWRGFAYDPVPYKDASKEAKEGFDILVEHTLKNVCDNNEEYFNWIMGYFAHMIQRPYERPLTTLVFKGRKGVGKNTLIERFGKLLGPKHFNVTGDSRYLTSNFNGHMDGCLCLVLDEAFWSGDKAAEGKLKTYTTGGKINIERKGKEMYTIDNLGRFVIIGNEDWIVPASTDERRYAVFNVGEGRKKDTDFFSKMVRLMDNEGGAAVLMDYLLNFDLSRVKVNVAPETEGLTEQKMQSLNSFQQYWLECLTEGTLVGTDAELDWENQPIKIGKEVFRKAFAKYCKERNIGSWVPNLMNLGRYLTDVSPSTNLEARLSVEQGRGKCYVMADLKTCRNEWDKLVGKYKWGEDSE